jgi:hypothetical protein
VVVGEGAPAVVEEGAPVVVEEGALVVTTVVVVVGALDVNAVQNMKIFEVEIVFEVCFKPYIL